MTSVAIADAKAMSGSVGAQVLGIVLGLAALAGCERGVEAVAPQAPAPVTIAPPEKRGDAALPAEDPLVAFYADVESELTASGRMRLDTAPTDAPYTVDDLVRNFERIALYDEYVQIGDRFVRSETPSLLRRWEQPVRVGVVIGESTAPEDAARDRAAIRAYTARLARLTGVDMAVTDGPDANFLVLILSNAEQLDASRITAAQFPALQPTVLDALAGMTPGMFCNAVAFAEPGRPSAYATVIVLIRAEHPPLTRQSCVNEEMAQAMGLPNDYDEARPSLFNNTLEFAFLTEHDEILLRMLYDPRLRTGMTVAEARPLLPAIARDALAAQAAEGGAQATLQDDREMASLATN